MNTELKAILINFDILLRRRIERTNYGTITCYCAQ